MQASVIICTYNRCDLLKESLLSVCRQDFAADQYEVVVVDNNSSDNTRNVVQEIATSSNVKISYLFEKRQGLSFARNSGIEAAQGEIVVFTDDDIEAEPQWLRETVAVFEDPETACAGGPLKPVWPQTRPEWLTDDMLPAIAVSDFPSAQASGEFKGPNYPWGANMAFRKAVFARTGLFPTNLGRTGKNLLSNEELEICRKIEKLGLRIRFAADAVIHHKIAPERLTKTWFLRRYYYQGRSDAVLYLGAKADIYRHLKSLMRTVAWRHKQKEKTFSHACFVRSALGYIHGLTESLEGTRKYSRNMRVIKTVMSAMAAASDKRDSKIEALQKYIEEKHQDLSAYADLLHGKNQALVDLAHSKESLQSLLAEKDKKIAELSTYIEEKHRDLTNYAALVKEKNQQLVHLENMKIEQEREISQLHHELSNMSVKLTDIQGRRWKLW